MLFNHSRRITEDLEKIKRANIDPIAAVKAESLSDEEKKKVQENLKGLTFTDYVAMVIAVLSIVVPYLLILLVVLGIFIFLFYLIYLK